MIGMPAGCTAVGCMTVGCMAEVCMAASGIAVSGSAECVMAVCGRATDCDCGKATGGSAALVLSGIVLYLDPAALGVVLGNSTIGTLDVCIVHGVSSKAAIVDGKAMSAILVVTPTDLCTSKTP